MTPRIANATREIAPRRAANWSWHTSCLLSLPSLSPWPWPLCRVLPPPPLPPPGRRPRQQLPFPERGQPVPQIPDPHYHVVHAVQHRADQGEAPGRSMHPHRAGAANTQGAEEGIGPPVDANSLLPLSSGQDYIKS